MKKNRRRLKVCELLEPRIVLAVAIPWEGRVAAGSDDAEQRATGQTVLNSPDLEMVSDFGGNQTVGMRFTGVAIPAGATITNAYLQFQVDERTSVATSLTIRGEDTANAQTFAATAGNISSRATTAAAVGWTPPAWTVNGDAGADQQTPNLAAIIQEIVDGPGWSSGNALALIVTGTGERVAEAYEGDQAGAPLLHVEYTVASNALDIRVAAGSDDAEQRATGQTVLNSPDLEMVSDFGGNQTVGMRFTGVAIPAGATITNAYLQFQVDERTSVATSLTIRGEDTANAQTFAATAGNISSRATTTAAVGWSPAAWTVNGAAGTDQQSPDLGAIVQEIVDGPGWSSGNALAMIITGTGERVAEAYEGDQAGAPLLHVEYTTGPGGNPCDTPGNVCFAVIGDYGRAGQAEQDVANLVTSWNTDFIITTGDNNYPDGEASTIDENIGQYYHEFIAPYSGSYGSGSDINRFFPSLGNHDWHAAGAQPYLDYFTLPGNERYYDFAWGPVHFFAIDSDSAEPDGTSRTSIQAAWLQSELAASTAPWKIVYMHHAPYSSSSLHGSSATLQWPFQEWGANAVLAGHDHKYERIVLDGFPYFVNGLGGSNIYDFGPPISGSQVQYNQDFGAMLVHANDADLTFQFFSRAGTLVDTYTLTNDNEVHTVDSRVGASSDDAEEQASGSMYLNSPDLEMVYDFGANQTVGMRFTGVDVPQGANIVNAYIQYQVDERTSVATSLVIGGEDTDSALTFSSSNFDLTSRTKTTASVAWSPVAWTTTGQAGPDQRTPNIASVIQEIVDRPGWSSGNSLAVLVNGTGERVAEAYDGDQSGAPLLHIEYTTTMALRVESAMPAPAFAEQLTDRQLKPIINEAILRLAGSGDPKLMDILTAVPIDIVDLPGNLLGQVIAGAIQIDVDAAGYGWFIDSTPADDLEFTFDKNSNRLLASARSPAAGHVDLLTVLLHEFGHTLGYGHDDSNTLMAPALSLGTRWLPTRHLADSFGDMSNLGALDEFFHAFGQTA